MSNTRSPRQPITRVGTAQPEPSPDEAGVESDVELYDSDVLAIEKLFEILSASIGSHRELSSFQREVRERFAEIGLVARCDFYEDENDAHLEGVQRPRISITGRCEALGEFDHDRMGHEVRSNILGKNAQGNVQAPQIAGGFEQKASGLIIPKK